MNGHTNEGEAPAAAGETGALTGTMRVKAGLAQMLKGGVIMGECRDEGGRARDGDARPARLHRRRVTPRGDASVPRRRRRLLCSRDSPERV